MTTLLLCSLAHGVELDEVRARATEVAIEVARAEAETQRRRGLTWQASSGSLPQIDLFASGSTGQGLTSFGFERPVQVQAGVGVNGSWTLVDTYSCTGWNESGPEVTYLFQPTADGSVTVDLANMNADLDVFVAQDGGAGCQGTACAAFGNTSATFSVQAGEDWYVTVDGFNGAVSDFDLTVTCN